MCEEKLPGRIYLSGVGRFDTDAVTGQRLLLRNLLMQISIANELIRK